MNTVSSLLRSFPGRYLPILAGGCLIFLFACQQVRADDSAKGLVKLPKIKGEVPQHVTPESLMRFLAKENQNVLYLDKSFKQLASIYCEFGKKYNVRWDYAFFQMMHETNSLKFGGTVSPEQYNFAGIGTVDQNTPGDSFEVENDVMQSIRQGVEAQMQHLALYAGDSLDGVKIVAPRTRLVRKKGWVKGSRQATFADLSGRWAGDKKYGEKIANYSQKYGVAFRGNLTPEWKKFVSDFLHQMVNAADHKVVSLRYTSSDLVVLIQPSAGKVKLASIVESQIRYATSPNDVKTDFRLPMYNLVGLKFKSADGSISSSHAVKGKIQVTFEVTADSKKKAGQTLSFDWTGKISPDKQTLEIRVQGEGLQKSPVVYRLKRVS